MKGLVRGPVEGPANGLTSGVLADAAAPGELGFDPARLGRLDDYMAGLVANNRVAGSAYLLARHGRVVACRAHGRPSLEHDAALSPDAIFRIYSMTKPVVAAALMILFEEGRWQLDDPVTRIIPEFRRLRVMREPGPDGQAATEELARPMTMRHLLSHTAGLGYGIFAAHPVDRLFREHRVMLSRTSQQLIERTAAVPLMFQPGTGWSYSSAADIQGCVVERLSGTTLGAFLQARIFEPLGMADTGFFLPPDKLGRLVRPYVGDADGWLVEATALFDMPIKDAAVPPTFESGGGGLLSSARDYARFCQMLLDGGVLGEARILSPAAIELMATDMLPQCVRDHPHPDQLVAFSDALGFGLGLMVEHDPRRNGSLVGPGTLSWGGAGGTWFWVDPARDVLFVGMTQRLMDPISSEFRIRTRTLTYAALVEPGR